MTRIERERVIHRLTDRHAFRFAFFGVIGGPNPFPVGTNLPDLLWARGGVETRGGNSEGCRMGQTRVSGFREVTHPLDQTKATFQQATARWPFLLADTIVRHLLRHEAPQALEFRGS